MAGIYSFLEYLEESSKEGKNTHLYHLEENIFNGGVLGTRESINFLQAFGKMLKGNSNSRLAVTTKVDGAPAIVFGIDPSSQKFFVATKHAAFGKTPKLSFTKEDIAKYHQGGLAEKLNIALENLPSVVKEKAVFQGDMMFDRESIQTNTIIGEERYITFQPNTIVYAVPKVSDLAKDILSKKMGLIVHTRYDGGPTILDMKASFKVDATKSFKRSNSVWLRDANIVADFSGSASFTKEETDQFYYFLSLAGKLFRSIPASLFNEIAENPEINLSVLTFHNAKIRKGESISNPQRHIEEMKEFISNRYDAMADKVKTDASKAKIFAKKDEVLAFISSYSSPFISLVLLYNTIVDAKLMVVRKLETIDKLKKFVRTSDGGFKVTADEGFVVSDHLSGKALKLVDRLEFSFNNFNAIKNWG